MDITTDVLVIGAGISGCAAALAAAQTGAQVLLLTAPPDPLESNTAYAQGGIVSRGQNDTPELLADDIQKAGVGLCLPDAVQHLAKDGPPLLCEVLVDRLKVPFNRDAKGNLAITEEAAHTMPRILHSEDLTGKAIALEMLKAVQDEEGIQLRPGQMAVDLLSVPDHGANTMDIYRAPCCVGAYVLDKATNTIYTARANQTILATGGLGQVYLHTTNPKVARGDGLAMAYRLGARLLNLEYVQFHPTTLYHRDADSYLITEAMRGEGGRLINAVGDDFMQDKHPQGPLAPRDIVARAIQNEMLESGRNCVYLDISHRDPDWIRNRFPNIHENCLKFHVDITRQPIPVVPAAHYSCGGIAVDLQAQTTVPGLRAVGEVACTGLHGANRLASTSLLEGLLWGWTAGKEAAQHNETCCPLPEIRPFVAEREPADPALVAQDWLTIKYTMWNYVGLSRTPRRMERAMHILRELQQEILGFYRKAAPNESILGLRNGITTALAILFAAQRNHTSRGCHFIEED